MSGRDVSNQRSMPGRRRGNPLVTVSEKLRRKFRDVSVEVDAPSRADGTWFLDLALKGHGLTVQWSKRRGFGVSAGRATTYGEGPDEIYSTVAETCKRAAALLSNRGSTSPPSTVQLEELRKLVGFSQVELAKSLDVQQSVVSKRERCADMMLSTLRATVEALGGSLDVRVLVRDRAVKLELPRPPGAGAGIRPKPARAGARRKRS